MPQEMYSALSDRNLLLEPNSAGGRLHEVLDLNSLTSLNSPICNPAACTCPSASITTLRWSQQQPHQCPGSQLGILAQAHLPQELALARWGGCNEDAVVGTSLQRGSNIWGLGNVTALQHDLLKPFLQSPEVLLFGWILLSFSTAGSVLHVQNFHSYRGRLSVGGLGGEESFAWKAASIPCSASTALVSSVLLQQSQGTVYKLQEILRLLRISTRSLSSLIFHKS